MRDASGYRNNYYRNARNGHPLNSTVVVNNGGGYPVQSGRTTKTASGWVGVNVGLRKSVSVQDLPPQLNCVTPGQPTTLVGRTALEPNQITCGATNSGLQERCED